MASAPLPLEKDVVTGDNGTILVLPPAGRIRPAHPLDAILKQRYQEEVRKLFDLTAPEGHAKGGTDPEAPEKHVKKQPANAAARKREQKKRQVIHENVKRLRKQ